ncbi:helix-turn-helix transcriptional regulator [Gordonia lacunae]|uniref:Helix-turn-helix domain-containing protein n=1 Tax=Gordonia lacunae TaxID=417102 RepID=A0A243Q708_9ACTN|nr:hypothetical protein CA982_17865 [Gordonia lacunae]
MSVSGCCGHCRSTTKVLLTVPEAAEALSTSVSQLYRLHKAGKITFTRSGERQTRVHIDEIRSYAASLRTF